MFKLLVELLIEIGNAIVYIPYYKIQRWYVVYRIQRTIRKLRK